MPVYFGERARRDLADIWYYLSHSSERTADHWVDLINVRCQSLSDFPHMGRARPDLAPDVRILVVDRWTVMYRVAENAVQIVRIVDSARDIRLINLPPS